MNKRSVKKNYIYNMLYQLLLIFLPIITTPYLARRLGAGGNGTFGYTLSIVTYFILFGSLGISLYGQREIAYNQKNKEKRSKIFWELTILRLITMCISALVFYIFFCTNRYHSIYFRILLLEMLASMIDISWFYQGMEDFKRTVIRNFIVKLISVACIFLFVKTKSDLYKYFFIYTGSTLFGSLTLWLGIWKHVEKPKKLNITAHLPFIIALFIPQIAIQIYTVLDKTMIGVILRNMTEVGYYEQSQKIVKILLTIITAVGTVMLPRIASCFAEGDHEKIKLYMMRTFNFVFMLSIPLTFGIIAVSNNFSPLFFGPGYEKVPVLMSILSIIVIFISLSNVTGTQFLLSTKREKEFTKSVVIGSVVNLCLNALLIPFFKSNGAAIATVFAELSVTLVQFYYVRKDFSIKEIIKLSTKYFLAGIIMFVCCFIVDMLFESKMISLVAQVATGVIVYFSLLLIFKDRFFIDLIKDNIIKRFKKAKN